MELFYWQGKAGSVSLYTTAKVTPSSSVPESNKDNNVVKVCRCRIKSVSLPENKQCHRKVFSVQNSFHFNVDTEGIRPQIQKLEPP